MLIKFTKKMAFSLGERKVVAKDLTEVNGIILPGRVAAFHRQDVKVLPSSETRSSVWRKYKLSAMTASGL